MGVDSAVRTAKSCAAQFGPQTAVSPRATNTYLKTMPPTLLRPALAFAFFFAGFASLHADTYTVTSNSDTDAAGTLRWAIGQANADADSTIALANNLGVVTLGSELTTITSAVTINGGTGNSVSGDFSLEGSMVNFASTGTTTYSGVISGSGGLLISGSGDVSSPAETHLTGTTPLPETSQ